MKASLFPAFLAALAPPGAPLWLRDAGFTDPLARPVDAPRRPGQAATLRAAR